MFIFLLKLLIKLHFTIKKWPQLWFHKRWASFLVLFFSSTCYSTYLFKSTSIDQSSIDTQKRKGVFCWRIKEVFSEELQAENRVNEWEAVRCLSEGEGSQWSGIPGRGFLYKEQQKMVFLRPWEVQGVVAGCWRGQEGFLLFRSGRRSLLDDSKFWATYQRVWVEWVIYIRKQIERALERKPVVIPLGADKRGSD